MCFIGFIQTYVSAESLGPKYMFCHMNGHEMQRFKHKALWHAVSKLMEGYIHEQVCMKLKDSNYSFFQIILNQEKNTKQEAK